VDEQGLDRDYFGDVHHLCHLVLKQEWPREVATMPIVLSYPTLSTLFKGRKIFLDRLRASFTRPDGGTAAIASRVVHCKTRAAVEYAWAHRDAYTALLLLDAETTDKLHSALAALVGPLRLPAVAAREEAARFEATLGWLNANPGWFVILDNIDTESTLEATQACSGGSAESRW
jgi:hypothetical protein